MNKLITSFFCFLLLTSYSYGQQKFNASQLLNDIEYLSSDALEGRAVGSKGSKTARNYIVKRFQQIGLTPFGKSFEAPFNFSTRKDNKQYQGTNVMGMVKGTTYPDSYIVITGHYDHLPMKGDSIYNGADDNASGTAAVMAMAEYFKKHPAKHSLIFVAFDAEEVGHQGATAFVKNPPVKLDQIRLNVNVDMISRNENDELYAVGTFYYPFLKPYIEKASQSTKLKIRFGHDSPAYVDADNWTNSSDHAAFHNAQIPFVYFGVEDHPDYHHPSDEFQHIDPAFYIRAVQFTIDAIKQFDAMPQTNKQLK